MAKKSVHQEFNPLAIEHFEIDCDPYGIMVDSSGTIETVYVNTSKGLTRTIENIFETNESFEPDLTLYKKAFLFPNSPVSTERVKAALKEHKITLTNDYTKADLYLTHHDLTRDHQSEESINSRAMFCNLWNYEAVEAGCMVVNDYCEENKRGDNLARVIYDDKCSQWVDRYNADLYSMPYDSYILTGLAVNTAYEVEMGNADVWSVDKVMHQSATKVELTQQILDDIVSLMKQGGEDNYNMVGALLPTIDWTKKHHLLWKLGQEIGTDLYMFNRNKDVQYWKQASRISDYYHMTALQMIKNLEEDKNLNRESFKYLEPIVRKEIRIENRDLYTFRVEVKPEYKKYNYEK
jgi:hypothetical protein